MGKNKKTIYPFFINEAGILIPVLALAGLGIVMVHSASAAISIDKYGSHLYFLQKQALFFGISLVIMFCASLFPYKLLKKLAYPLLAVSFIMLTAIHMGSLGITAGGATRWLKIGGITFQPSEFTKLALIIFLAYSLNKKQDLLKSFSVGFIPHALLFGLIALLILQQPDLGTVVIIGAITWLMMFIAGVPVIHLLSPLPLAVPFVYFAIYKVDYRMERILAFLNPWADPQNTGYQITHSLKAFGSGGIFGKGIGLGMQKLYYLPEPHTDFILSIIGEELGLAGVITILLLYTIILFRGISIAKSADTLFGTFVAAGLTISLGLQVIINTGVTLGVLPTKGLTLPFLSYGGTSLVINMACMGILMNIASSNYNKKG